MRIGIDARFYGSIGKGLGRYTQKLIEHLEDVDSRNQYFVFLRRENFDEYVPKNTRFVKVLADYRWYSFSEQFLFPILLLKYRLDLVHFPHFNIPILYFKKFIVTIHDLILIRFPTQRSTTLHPLWYWMKFLAYKFVIFFAVKKSCHIMTVSQFTKNDILEHYPIPEEKVTVSYEAANPFCFYSSKEKAEGILRKYGLLKHSVDGEKYGIIQPYLLYVGNAYPHKNLELLVEVMNRGIFHGITLVLVGKEDYFYQRLKKFVKKIGCKNIIFTGFVPDDELDVLYRFGRAYLFPSLYEGFGLPPLEAMSKGLPVIAASGSCLPEILGDAALYFDPRNKESLVSILQKLLSDESLQKRLSKRGSEQSVKFHWKSMAEETLLVYEKT